VFGAATFFNFGLKGFAASVIGGEALDLGSTALNAAAYTGRGHAKARIKTGAKQEAINTVAGNAVFFAGLIGQRKGREGLIKYGSKAANFFKRVGSKIL
jgi:hypothetical protein